MATNAGEDPQGSVHISPSHTRLKRAAQMLREDIQNFELGLLLILPSYSSAVSAFSAV
jgi:hypothetical protein